MGTCDNFVLEAHYKIIFEPTAESQANAFKVKDLIVDVVYG